MFILQLLIVFQIHASPLRFSDDVKCLISNLDSIVLIDSIGSNLVDYNSSTTKRCLESAVEKKCDYDSSISIIKRWHSETEQYNISQFFKRRNDSSFGFRTEIHLPTPNGYWKKDFDRDFKFMPHGKAARWQPPAKESETYNFKIKNNSNSIYAVLRFDSCFIVYDKIVGIDSITQQMLIKRK